MLNVAADALLPPASLALLAFLLMVVGGPRARRAAVLLLTLFLAMGTALVSTALSNSLVTPDARPGAEPGAIVVLSGDAIRLPPPSPLEPGLLTLERMRAGAELQRRTGLPVLVSGGQFLDAPESLAAMMVRSLRRDFSVDVRWQEDRSADTWQNAAFSAAILREAGITRVYLVTHVWHMRRAMLAFRRFGLDPVPSPVRPARWPAWSWDLLMLRPAAWQGSYFALHEWVGLAYYALRS